MQLCSIGTKKISVTSNSANKFFCSFFFRFQDETMRGAHSRKNARAAKLLLVLKFSTEIFLSFVVLLCSVVSKLTLVGLTDNLRDIAATLRNKTDVPNPETASRATTLYWQLLLILLAPNCVTVVRCLLFGFIGKSYQTFPFPNLKAVILGLVVTVLEVLAISTLIFLVLSEFSPGVSILLMSGVFITQIFVNLLESDFVKHVFSFSRKSRFVERPADKASPVNYKTCCSVSIKLLAFLLQVTGLIGLVGYWLYTVFIQGANLEFRVVVGLPVALITLSVVWSNRVQKFISRSSMDEVSARYKSSKSLDSFFFFIPDYSLCLGLG